MNLQEIKKAITDGLIVHWGNDGYTVILDSVGQYLIGWNIGGMNENYIGLTGQDGRTLNGKENDFYINW